MDQNRAVDVCWRDFKRDIELDNLKIYIRHLRPNRSWLDLFSLTLSCYFYLNKFDFTILTDNLNADEVIVIDSHDDIFKNYQIHHWRKDRISDILPAIKCPSFKTETMIFKFSETNKIRKFIYNQNHTKSIVIEKTDEELSLNLVYGNTVKIGPWTFIPNKHNAFDKLQERYELWEISDCAWKSKKIRVWVDEFENLKYTIENLKWISNINDIKLGMHIYCKNYNRSFSSDNIIVFNHSAEWESYSTKCMFSVDTLIVVFKGNYYNFNLDERTKKSKKSFIRGKYN